MNPYWFIAFIVWSIGCIFAGWKAESWRLGEQQNAAIVKNEDHVIDNMKQSNVIDNKVEEQHEKDIRSIDSLYGNSLQSTPSAMPKLSNATSQSCTVRSLKYKLSLKQCDIEESKLKDLWDWNQQQVAIK